MTSLILLVSSLILLNSLWVAPEAVPEPFRLSALVIGLVMAVAGCVRWWRESKRPGYWG